MAENTMPPPPYAPCGHVVLRMFSDAPPRAICSEGHRWALQECTRRIGHPAEIVFGPELPDSRTSPTHDPEDRKVKDG